MASIFRNERCIHHWQIETIITNEGAIEHHVCLKCKAMKDVPRDYSNEDIDHLGNQNRSERSRMEIARL